MLLDNHSFVSLETRRKYYTQIFLFKISHNLTGLQECLFNLNIFFLLSLNLNVKETERFIFQFLILIYSIFPGSYDSDNCTMNSL